MHHFDFQIAASEERLVAKGARNLITAPNRKLLHDWAFYSFKLKGAVSACQNRYSSSINTEATKHNV